MEHPSSSRRATLLLILSPFLCQLTSAAFLSIQDGKFYYGSDPVFLSGSNIAWVSYGYDFGNGQYEGTSGATYRQYVDQISVSGGNTLRFWLHVEAENTPEFNADGYVLSPDASGTLISELAQFLDYAAEKNVFVIIVLWNGALMRNERFTNLVWDELKLDSYIVNVLRPMVRSLATKPALAAWEIMNEPEGSIRIEANVDPCYDTTIMGQYGAGWSGASIPMELFLRFVNWQASAIHQEDPKALVTLGSWSEHPQSDSFPDTVNYYKDSCLVGGGGKGDGYIDFYQMHTYSWEGNWGTNAPFRKNGTDYGLDKPLIIGEFSSVCAMGEGIEGLFDYAYNHEFSGVLSWQFNAGGECSDDQATQERGMNHIRHMNSNGIIPVDIQ